MAAIRGVSRSVVRAVTTPPKAAPMTTPTAISTTFPRRMNFLNPLNITSSSLKSGCRQCKAGGAGGQGDGRPGRLRRKSGTQNWRARRPPEGDFGVLVETETLLLASAGGRPPRYIGPRQILMGMTIYRYL